MPASSPHAYERGDAGRRRSFGDGVRPRWSGDNCVEYAKARLRELRGRKPAAAFASRPVVEYGAKNACAEHAGSARHAVSRLSILYAGQKELDAMALRRARTRLGG